MPVQQLGLSNAVRVRRGCRPATGVSPRRSHEPPQRGSNQVYRSLSMLHHDWSKNAGQVKFPYHKTIHEIDTSKITAENGIQHCASSYASGSWQDHAIFICFGIRIATNILSSNSSFIRSSREIAAFCHSVLSSSLTPTNGCFIDNLPRANNAF